MNTTVILPREFDVKHVSLKAVKQLETGGKYVPIEYSGKRFRIQSPNMPIPFGLNIFDKNGPANLKYDVQLNFRNSETDPKTREFHDALKAFDDYCIDQGVKNAAPWFKMQDGNRQIIKAFYTPCVKMPGLDAAGKPKPYPPTFKVSLKQKDNKFTTEFYDENRREYEGVGPKDLLLKGAEISVLLECSGLWFAGGKFGASWKAIQIKVNKLPMQITGSLFRDEEDDGHATTSAAPISRSNNMISDDEGDDDLVHNLAPLVKKVVIAAAAAPVIKKAVPAPTEEEDEDEDEDENEVVEPVPVPKPIIKKTIVGGPVKKVQSKLSAK